MSTPTSTTAPGHAPGDAPGDAPEYVLGTDAVEAQRLALQHRLWSGAAHEIWDRAGVRPGSRVLDLGCGPGHATLDLAAIVGAEATLGAPRTGRVVALDESPAFLEQLRQACAARGLTNVTPVQGDAQKLGEALRAEPATAAVATDRAREGFDVAYARWVFCFLADPEGAVRDLAGVIKPGGRVAIQDYFNYTSMTLAPRSEAYTAIVEATARSWRSRGGDPDIVSRLPAMLARHGFEVTHLDVRQRLARPGSLLWTWPESWWKSFVPRLTQMGFITPAQETEFFAAWARASADPHAFTLVPPVFDLVAVRKG
jgi:ubiquinone/menaquinone biosynthesis C-methylase UbiE